ncbi:MAG: YkgJ family cysteine cluster protein [Verrucomicrobiae bacterium]
MCDTAGEGDRAERLCAACGLCCNGVMFHGVELQPEDSHRRLSALGLRPKRRRSHIPQPCSAHAQSRCAIYAHRPARCRAFVCRLLERLAARAICEAEALEIILEAKALELRLREQFQLAGDVREHKAFASRYEAVFAPPLDPAAARLRDDIAAAMRALEQTLEKDFRIGAAAVPGGQREETG